MDDLDFGTRDKRGNWTPSRVNDIAPFWRIPWDGKAVLGWLVGYFLPWNLCWMILATVYWVFLTPEIETLKTLSPGWILYLLVRNSAAILIFYSAMDYRLYRQRRQGTAFKYNGQFPEDKPSEVFLLRSQAKYGMIRTFGTGVPLWTAYEVLILWCYANGIGPWTTLAENPVWLVLIWLLLPIFHEFHFFCVHRLIHVPVLYKHIHSVHHNSVNPSPWSSLSMHPVEHLLYFSGALIHLIIPSHPLVALYALNFAGMGAIVGHIGFDKILSKDEEKALDTHSYTHYLHHKFFEVNYGEGSVPLDKVFGTWHDGTKASDDLLGARMRKRREKAKLKAG